MRFTQEQMEILSTKLQNGSLTLQEFILLLQEPVQPKVDIDWTPDVPQPTINPYHPYPPNPGQWYTTGGGVQGTSIHFKPDK